MSEYSCTQGVSLFYGLIHKDEIPFYELSEIIAQCLDKALDIDEPPPVLSWSFPLGVCDSLKVLFAGWSHEFHSLATEADKKFLRDLRDDYWEKRKKCDELTEYQQLNSQLIPFLPTMCTSMLYKVVGTMYVFNTSTTHVDEANDVISREDMILFIRRFGPLLIGLCNCAFNLFNSQMHLLSFLHGSCPRAEEEKRVLFDTPAGSLSTTGRYMLRFSQTAPEAMILTVVKNRITLDRYFFKYDWGGKKSQYLFAASRDAHYPYSKKEETLGIHYLNKLVQPPPPPEPTMVENYTSRRVYGNFSEDLISESKQESAPPTSTSTTVPEEIKEETGPLQPLLTKTLDTVLANLSDEDQQAIIDILVRAMGLKQLAITVSPPSPPHQQ